MQSEETTRVFLKTFLLLFLAFSFCSNQLFLCETSDFVGVASVSQEVLQLKGEQKFDSSKVYVLYSNVFVVDREDTAEYVKLVLTGPSKQTAWIVLASPWKPLSITSNNTSQKFVELKYDPQNMTSNPIADTHHPYAWDYDEINKVVFIKLLITSTVTVTVRYVYPVVYPPQIFWITFTLIAIAALVGFYFFRRRRKRGTRTRKRPRKVK